MSVLLCFTNPDIFSLVKFKLVRKKTRQVSMMPGSRVSYRQVLKILKILNSSNGQLLLPTLPLGKKSSLV